MVRCQNKECDNEHLVAINKEKTHYYCPKCNSSFMKGEEIKKGSLSFNGVSSAKSILDLLLQDRKDINPAMRGAIETQMTTIIFEQWFEGFKAGQLASITYSKEYYNDNGKNRDESKNATSKHERGTEASKREACNGENSLSNEQNFRTNSEYTTVRERIGGIEFLYPSHIKVPENIYQKAAQALEETLSIRTSDTNFLGIKRFMYNGSELSLVLKN